MLRAYGAELQLTPGHEGMKGALDLANELSLYSNSYQFNQFENPQIQIFMKKQQPKKFGINPIIMWTVW